MVTHVLLVKNNHHICSYWCFICLFDIDMLICVHDHTKTYETLLTHLGQFIWILYIFSLLLKLSIFLSLSPLSLLLLLLLSLLLSLYVSHSLFLSVSLSLSLSLSGRTSNKLHVKLPNSGSYISEIIDLVPVMLYLY